MRSTAPCFFLLSVFGFALAHDGADAPDIARRQLPDIRQGFPIPELLPQATAQTTAEATAQATAKPKSKKQPSTLERCTMLQQFNDIIDTAANSTKLFAKFHGNATRIARFLSEAADLQNGTSRKGMQFRNLQSNATFLGICDAVFATEFSDAACVRMILLESRADVVTNTTRLEQASGGNATRAAQLLADVAREQPELNALQTNTTLLEFCAGFMTRAQCNVVRKLDKDVRLARNASRLNATLNGNRSRIADFQRMASMEIVQLGDLLSNGTLVNICKTQLPDILELEDTTTSAAPRSQAGPALSLVAFFSLGLLLL